MTKPKDRTTTLHFLISPIVTDYELEGFRGSHVRNGGNAAQPVIWLVPNGDTATWTSERWKPLAPNMWLAT